MAKAIFIFVSVNSGPRNRQNPDIVHNLKLFLKIVLNDLYFHQLTAVRKHADNG